MVKIGFICEGETEKLIIESYRFRQFLFDNNCELLKVIDATGNGNLLPKNISPFIQILNEEGAQTIFILTDLDVDVCITQTKQRINAPDDVIVIIAVQQIESWFLADNETLSKIFGNDFKFDFPERENNPRETLRNIFIENTQRGLIDSKPRFAKWILKQGFTIVNASSHSNCPSAKYFIDKILNVGTKK